MPQRKLLRSLILIPYAIPAFISTVVWRGMFDPNLGIINEALEPLFGSAPNWYTDGNAARFAILMIQMWLGFPYMMLICTGALQALPSDIYEAAEVDGASAFQRFRRITLPLLLVAVGPLLIASFAFNFNNFTVIELFNSGGPAIANSAVPAGHTDILITYTYAQAFGGDGGADYALASAISVFIFIIVAAITIFNFRFTKSWEAVSENV
jgi:ABC-type sugar transport system permease subunit